LHLLAQGWVYKEITNIINQENPEKKQASGGTIRNTARIFRNNILKLRRGNLADFLRAIYRLGLAPPVPELLLADVKRWARNLPHQQKSVLMAAVNGATSYKKIAAQTGKKKGDVEVRLKKGTVSQYIQIMEGSLRQVTYPGYSLHFWQVAAMLSVSELDWTTNVARSRRSEFMAMVYGLIQEDSVLLGLARESALTVRLAWGRMRNLETLRKTPSFPCSRNSLLQYLNSLWGQALLTRTGNSVARKLGYRYGLPTGAGYGQNDGPATRLQRAG
jgi:hypothetical protein